MAQDLEAPLFFIHVMKTAGATLRHQLRAALADDQIYPSREQDPDLYQANSSIDQLLALRPERRARIRVYLGHFPYVAAEMLGDEVVTLTVLREPVARTVSILKHLRVWSVKHRQMSLEMIYDDAVLNSMYVSNHQTKVFAITPHDRVSSYVDRIDIDADRLALAEEHLARVDILGIAEHFDEVVTEVNERFGWQLSAAKRRNVSPTADDVTPRLLQRIEEDNQPELEFYEFGRRLYEERRLTREGPRPR